MDSILHKQVKEKSTVAGISVFAALFLTGFKLAIGLITGSLGLLSEALHSGLDLIAAVITYFSVRVSDKPPDPEHRFGHGKIENLSAFLETILLLITCFWIIYEAINRLVTGNTHIQVNTWSYIVIVSSILIDITRSRALYKVARKYNSQALEADALHFSTDIYSSGVVLLGLVCAHFGFFFADSVAALCVALIVLFISYRLGKRAIDVLLDRTPEETPAKIETVLRSITDITSYHDIRIRTAGADTFVDINIHVKAHLTIQEAHQISHRVEAEINAVIPRCDVHVHAEPDTE